MNNLMKSLGNKPRKGFVIECKHCKKEFYINPSRVGTKKYCSHHCYAFGQRRNTMQNCAQCGREYYVAISSQKWRHIKCCSIKCRSKWASVHLRGENSSLWRGGKSSIYKRIRSSARYADWRSKVFNRDHYTCLSCGARNGNGKSVYLEPHHLIPFSDFTAGRFLIKNGMTLCRDCHQVTKKPWWPYMNIEETIPEIELYRD